MICEKETVMRKNNRFNGFLSVERESNVCLICNQSMYKYVQVVLVRPLF